MINLTIHAGDGYLYELTSRDSQRQSAAQFCRNDPYIVERLKERFLVSIQTNNTKPDAKLAFQHDSGLAPIWATSFDQLEYADSDPQLIADILATPYDPSQEYLGGKHDPKVLSEVMTPEYQEEYAKDINAFKSAGGNEFNDRDQAKFSNKLPEPNKIKFNARHNARTEIGANSEFTGNGLTQSRGGSTTYGVVETLTWENNPPPITQMKNVKTIQLKPRGLY